MNNQPDTIPGSNTNPHNYPTTIQHAVVSNKVNIVTNEALM